IANSPQMRAKLFVNLPVLSFGKEMQIDLAHEWAVLIRIPCELFRAIPFCDAQTVGEIARRARQSCAKESILLNSFCCNRLADVSIHHDLDLARVRTKDADFQIVANLVRPQHAERICVRS